MADGRAVGGGASHHQVSRLTNRFLGGSRFYRFGAGDTRQNGVAGLKKTPASTNPRGFGYSSQLEKAAYGPFSDNSFVSVGKRRDFCRLLRCCLFCH
jgi:hypothetical protein